jgi:hypothetical protein
MPEPLLLIEEIHSVLSPDLFDRQQLKSLTMQRMKGMRYPMPLSQRTRRIACSRSLS